MIIKKLVYCLALLLNLSTFIFSRVAIDNGDSIEHPDILIEDLANLTDLDLEFKDSDQLELLLAEIDDDMRDPQNDFEGRFNVPEITDHVNEGIPGNIRYGSKMGVLQQLKQRINGMLSERNFELGPREIK